MTTPLQIHSATRSSTCVGRGVPAGLAGLERQRAYAGTILAAARWSGRSVLGAGNLAEGFGLCSKDMTREVLPT